MAKIEAAILVEVNANLRMSKTEAEELVYFLKCAALAPHIPDIGKPFTDIVRIFGDVLQTELDKLK